MYTYTQAQPATCPRGHKTARPYLLPVDGLIDSYVVHHGHAFLDADGNVVADAVYLPFDVAESARERHEFRVG